MLSISMTLEIFFFFFLLFILYWSACSVASVMSDSDPVDYSPPSSSVRGSLQARILEWVAISFSRGIFLTQGSNLVSCTAGGFFTAEPRGTPYWSVAD